MALIQAQKAASSARSGTHSQRERRSPRVLLLYHEASRLVGTTDAHVRGLVDFSRHTVVECDASYIQKYQLDLDHFDLIVLHYSLIISSEQYLAGEFVSKLRQARAAKVIFIQDEYRWVDRTAATAQAIGVDCIFTVVNKEAVRRIYHHQYFDRVRFETTLTGFVPEELTKVEVPEFVSRPIEVGYRARKLPGWLGAFGQQKWMIGERFNQDAQQYDLKCDISSCENDRLYGEDWIRFISASKAMLGTESGASFIDFTGEVQKAVEAYEARYPNTSFSEIQDKFLEGRDGDITIHVISPRCFEAAALRTLMIMYPGDYSGILKPNRHYVPLNVDHSNMDEVVAVLRDPDQAMEIIDCAYREIACSDSWRFATFVRRFDDVVSELYDDIHREARMIDAQSRLTEAEFEGVVENWSRSKESWARKRRRKISAAIRMKRLSDGVTELLRKALPNKWQDPVIYGFNEYKKRVGLFLLRAVFGRD